MITENDEEDLFDDLQAMLSIVTTASQQKRVGAMRQDVLRVMAVLRKWTKKGTEWRS